MMNEATCAYTREYAMNHYYEDRSHSENESFLNEPWKIAETPIEEIMICVCHGDNTVDKTIWQTDQYKSKIPNWFWKTQHYKLLKEIFSR